MLVNDAAGSWGRMVVYILGEMSNKILHQESSLVLKEQAKKKN